MTRITAFLLWVAGVSLFVALILREGAGEVLTAVAGVGWGVAAIVAYHAVPLVTDAAAWRVLVRRGQRPSLPRSSWIRWIGESVNGLLPVAQIGGELARVRLAMLHGLPGAQAGATITVDVTVATLSQIALALAALGVLFQPRATGAQGDFLDAILLGLIVLAVLVGIFAVVQNAGLFRTLARVLVRAVGGEDRFALVGGAEALDREIAALYRRRELFVAVILRMLGWVLGAGEVWLALYFLGHPVGVVEALMLEILTHGARSAGFFIPAGLGVQEGAFILLGGAVGLDPQTALAVSLVKRIRELSLGIPGLITWQVIEGRRLWRRRKGDRSAIVGDRATE